LATVFPPELPNGLNECERKLFTLLKRLGDDCFVYFEPRVRNRRPDFVVIIPDVGVLIVEVKGWAADQIVGASPDRVTLDMGGDRTSQMHPEEQARKYAYALIDTIRRHRDARHIVQSGGPHRGSFAFPVAWIAAYCNVTRAELEDRGLEPCFPKNRNVTRDVLSEWSCLDAPALRSALRTYFDPWWPHSMSWFEATLIKDALYPIGINQRGSRFPDEDVKTLDARQEQLAFSVGEGHRIVRGVSGSGKTVILIARAKYLAALSDRRILILCYNKLLSEFIKSAVKEFGNITVRTFHGWSGSNGVVFKPGVDDESLGAALRERLEASIAPDAGQFDAVLVDEAQLMSRAWLACARLALKERDPEKASLFIACDGSQSLRKMLPFTWKEAGILAPGRTAVLKINYRNTREILLAASSMASSPGRDPQSEGPRDPTGAHPEECPRRGAEPQFIRLSGRQSECDYAVALVQTWLLGGVQIRGKTVKPLPEDIAIIYPRNPYKSPDLIAELAAKLSPIPAVMLSRERPGKLSDAGIRIMSMKKSPGLQFRFVILLWTDLLPARFTDDDDEALLYMAITRAEDMLVILHSGRSQFIDRISRTLDAPTAKLEDW
jgi:hypothetical protein